jgi:hypothetical protein
MKKIYTCILLSLMLTGLRSSAQQALRGMYIDHFSAILGNTVKEDSLLNYMTDSSYNYIALYDLHSLNLTSSTTANMLANFISRAKNTFGIQYVGAVSETYSTFQNKITVYNNSRLNPSERFNVFNLEFEFWNSGSVGPGGYYCTAYLQQNNCSCDTSGAFKFYISQMHKIDSLAALQNVISETYVGWFNQGQGRQLAQNADRILLHAYRTDPSSVYGYSRTRLQYLASNNTIVNVAPIFSSEDNFMGPWLDSHSQIEAYNKYKADFDADNAAWKPYINMLGYHWFDYGEMPKPVPAQVFTPVITTNSSTSFCDGGSVTLTASTGNSYVWNTGATTQSIIVSSGGTFSCTVTQNSLTGTTTPVTVNVLAIPSVSVSAVTQINGDVSLTATANTSSGTITAYQWFLNSAAISGATSSAHNATVSGDYSVRVTNSNGCTKMSSVQQVTVTVPAPPSNCTVTTPNGLRAYPVSSTSELLQWNPVTADSIVIRYAIGNSSNFSYARFAFAGQNSFILTGLQSNAKYSWRVKTVCNNVSSSWSGKKTFSTAPAISSAGGNTVTKSYYDEDSEETEETLFLYPSPANTFINMEMFSNADTEASIMITDMNGRIIQQKNIYLTSGDNSSEINTADLSEGIYFVSVISSQSRSMQKIIIQH